MATIYYILLGKTADLAFAELESVANRNSWSPPIRLSTQIASVENVEDSSEILAICGGSVKVFESIPLVESIEKTIATDLISTNQPHFALSTFQARIELKDIANQVKLLLQEANIKPHFRLLESPLSSAGIGSRSSEYFISESETVPEVLKTIAVQHMKFWSIKDYDRPAFDPRSGMLPPKVARMMVNLALPNKITSSTTLYDPFCGSGTLLIEGIDSNVNVIGSDISKKAIEDSQTNCDWFVKRFDKTSSYSIFLSDATQVKVNQLGSQVDGIVFEGFLGPPSPDYARIPNILKGLEKLYKGTLKNLYPLLKPNARLVCALPEFVVGKSVKNLDSLIDWAQSLGYTRYNRFTYGRPQAVVKRSIYVLQKTA